VPSLVHVAGGELVAMPDIAYGGALGRGGRLIAAGGLKGADHVTVATQWMAAHVRARRYRVDDVVPLGVDTERFRPADGEPAAAPGQPPRLVHIGSLNGVKDQATLLKAFATVHQARPDATLDIAGVDTTDGATRRLAAQFGVADAVRFHGFVPSDELVALVQGASLHVLSSRHDAGPVAVLEAAACGVPTVGTAVGHVADLAAADPPGAVAVPIRHADELAAAILAVLDDEPRRRALAAAARAFALANDRRATVARFDAAYRQLLARR
jgi:glycosyltransferase involved in cell wall biosynthesis